MASVIPDDVHLAAVSRVTQIEADRRRSRRRENGSLLSLRLAVLLVRAGLRLAEPLTVERILCPGASPPARAPE